MGYHTRFDQLGRMPISRRVDDELQFGIVPFPTERFDRVAGIRHQHGGIPVRRGPSRTGTGFGETLATASMTSRTGFPAGARLKARLGLPVISILQGSHMRVRQVSDMDIVADGGAIGRRIIGAVNLYGRPLPPAPPG